MPRSNQPQRRLQFIIKPHEYDVFVAAAENRGVSNITLFRKAMAAYLGVREGSVFQPLLHGARSDLGHEAVVAKRNAAVSHRGTRSRRPRVPPRRPSAATAEPTTVRMDDVPAAIDAHVQTGAESGDGDSVTPPEAMPVKDDTSLLADVMIALKHIKNTIDTPGPLDDWHRKMLRTIASAALERAELYSSTRAAPSKAAADDPEVH